MSSSITPSSSQLSESAFSVGSGSGAVFQFVHEIAKEEQRNALHQLKIFKFQENVLIEETRNMMLQLESFKREMARKGDTKEVADISLKQEQLKLKFRREKELLKRVRKFYNNTIEENNFFLLEKTQPKEPINSLSIGEPSRGLTEEDLAECDR